jgi:hypothetical protein
MESKKEENRNEERFEFSMPLNLPITEQQR